MVCVELWEPDVDKTGEISEHGFWKTNVEMSKPVTKAVLMQVLTALVAKHWKSLGPTWYAAHCRKIKGPDSTAHSRSDGLNVNVETLSLMSRELTEMLCTLITFPSLNT